MEKLDLNAVFTLIGTGISGEGLLTVYSRDEQVPSLRSPLSILFLRCHPHAAPATFSGRWELAAVVSSRSHLPVSATLDRVDCLLPWLQTFSRLAVFDTSLPLVSSYSLLLGLL